MAVVVATNAPHTRIEAQTMIELEISEELARALLIGLSWAQHEGDWERVDVPEMVVFLRRIADAYPSLVAEFCYLPGWPEP